MDNNTRKKGSISLADVKKKGELVLTGTLATILLVAVALVWLQSNRLKTLSEESSKLKEEVCALESKLHSLCYAESNAVISAAVTELSKIREPVTVEYDYTNISVCRRNLVHNCRSLKFVKIIDTEVREPFALKWDGVVRAGVVLESLEIKFDEANNILILHLPRANILSHKIDFDSTEVFNEKDGTFSLASVNNSGYFRYCFGRTMEKKATNRRLLKKAEENAEAVLTKLLYANPEIKKCTLQFEFK